MYLALVKRKISNQVQGRTECGAPGALAPGAAIKGPKLGNYFKRLIAVYFNQCFGAAHSKLHSPNLLFHIFCMSARFSCKNDEK